MIRQLFCKHEWENVTGEIAVWNEKISTQRPVEFKIVFVCKKCLKKKIIKI